MYLDGRVTYFVVDIDAVISTPNSLITYESLMK